MQFAGFAEGARKLLTGLSIGLAFCAGQGAWAQSPQAWQFYEEGLRAMAQGNHARARDAFGEAVAADPSFAGAWFDLAVAAHADGDHVQAEEFLDILERRFTLPPRVATGVSALRRRIDAARSPAGWRWRSNLQAGGGYDTNANAGLATRDLSLTLPGGALVLPLDAAFLPRRDTHALAHLSTEGRLERGDGQVEVGASLRTRRNASEANYDTLETQASLGYASRQPAFGGLGGLLPGPWRLGTSLQMAQLGRDTVFRSTTLSVLHAWTQVTCVPQAQSDMEFRRFPVASALDSRVYWLGGQVSCQSPLPGPADRIRFQLRLGREIAVRAPSEPGGRPGGDTQHRELAVSHNWSWSGSWGIHKLEILWQGTLARDTDGYSPLLADNAARRVTRTTGAAAYTLPLPVGASDGGRWAALLTAQSFRQDANLPVFRMRGELFQMTLQRSW